MRIPTLISATGRVKVSGNRSTWPLSKRTKLLMSMRFILQRKDIKKAPETGAFNVFQDCLLALLVNVSLVAVHELINTSSGVDHGHLTSVERVR